MSKQDNASGAGMDLHAWIMNIPCAEVDANAEWSDRRIAYKMGHQHARHVAAELALDATRLLAESQAHNAKLEAQVERMRGDLKLIAESIHENEDWLRALAHNALKP